MRGITTSIQLLVSASCLFCCLVFSSAVAQSPTPASILPSERVQADVSTRTVGITSSFTGTEIIVFGAISNARNPEDSDAEYNVVVIVEGVGSALVARQKSNVGGIWVNTKALHFRHVPSYYAIASTRPLDEITESILLDQHGIGFDHISMHVKEDKNSRGSKEEFAKFKQAVIRLKQKQRLYVQHEFGVVFVGNSLFRTTIDLPANVPVGPLNTRVHLFRDGILLDTFTSRVQLEREGVGRYLYNFAIGYPLLYGIAAVFAAGGAGWAASAFFSRRNT